MKTTAPEPSHMENHTSLEAQYAAVRDSDFIRCIGSLDLYGFKLVGLRQQDAMVIMQTGDWIVEVDQDGLVKTQGTDKAPADFNTFQLHNLSRLLELDAE